MIDQELPRRSLLDAGTSPIEELARIARRESVRPRDAYQAHKWFARRLATTARSLLAAAVSDRGAELEAHYGGTSCEGSARARPVMAVAFSVARGLPIGAERYGADVEPVAESC